MSSLTLSVCKHGVIHINLEQMGRSVCAIQSLSVPAALASSNDCFDLSLKTGWMEWFLLPSYLCTHFWTLTFLNTYILLLLFRLRRLIGWCSDFPFSWKSQCSFYFIFICFSTFQKLGFSNPCIISLTCASAFGSSLLFAFVVCGQTKFVKIVSIEPSRKASQTEIKCNPASTSDGL